MLEVCRRYLHLLLSTSQKHEPGEKLREMLQECGTDGHQLMRSLGRCIPAQKFVFLPTAIFQSPSLWVLCTRQGCVLLLLNFTVYTCINWIGSHSRVNKSDNVGSSRINGLLFVYDWCRLYPTHWASNTGLRNRR